MHHHHPTPAQHSQQQQQQQRRRKKRPNYGTRTVEVRRGYNGFGFTISGQQPCRLSCIVSDSPADQAGLRAGDFLISVNNLNVSKLPHETVVQLIGNSFGSIRMQIAENYFSDSSDEENALLLQAGASSIANVRMKPSYLHHKMKMNRLRNSPQKLRGAGCMSGSMKNGLSVNATNSNTRTLDKLKLRPVIEDIPLVAPIATTSTSYNVIPKANANISNDISNVSAMVHMPAAAAGCNGNNAGGDTCHIPLEYRAIVGYLGTIEMPRQISNSSKLQTVRSCIRKLRQEKRQPTTVLMTILPNCLRLQAANGSVLATYTAARLNYVSSSSESENRFFGLVTSAIHTSQADDDEDDDVEEDDDDDNVIDVSHPTASNISISNSCHVFVIDTKLCDHQAHVERAQEFRIECTKDPISQLCLEFPNNSEYVVNLIRSMYTMRILPPAAARYAEQRQQDLAGAQANSPQPSNHSEVSTTTSNSDSGIGFHNDCNNISDRILVVDFPAAQLLAAGVGAMPARIAARPLGIFNNIDPLAAASSSRLTVRAMPDPKTPPTMLLQQRNAAPNLLASFNLIKSPASSLTATRSCDDVLSLMEHCATLPQDAADSRKSMDDISLHSTAMDDCNFLHPANLAKPHANYTNIESAYTLLQDCRAGVRTRSSLQHVPSKLSPKVYATPVATTTVQTKESNMEDKYGLSLSRTRRSLGYNAVVKCNDEYNLRPPANVGEFDTWSSLQDIYSTVGHDVCKQSTSTLAGNAVDVYLEATNSEPDLGNRAIPSNASPFRRAWGQSSFRTPRTDKSTLLHPHSQSPLVRRTASMNASDNDVYIKSMDTYIDELKQTRSQQQIGSGVDNAKFYIPTSNNTTKTSIPPTFAAPNKKPSVAFAPAITFDTSATTNTAAATTTVTTKATQPPVPTGVAGWGTSFERLLEDPAGLQTFAEFLKKEFSAENIYFWTACERFRNLDNECERSTQAMAIFSKHLANGSLEPVNVDSQARNLTEEKLQSAERDIFAQAQKQIFNLMKFDSYQRFIRSDLYKSCLEAKDKHQPLPFSGEDLDELLKTNFQQVASSKLKKSASNAEDRRRKSLLPWHRKTRCKSRDRSEADAGANKLTGHTPSKLPQLSSSSLKIPSTQSSMSDIHSSRSSLSSFDTLPGATLQHSNGQFEEIKPCSLCRVILSDGATTIVQTRPGDTVGQLVERLLEKRGLSYQFYDVVINGSSKSIDLANPAQILAGKEVLIEQRVAFKLDLPDPKVISVKSKPKKQLHEVIRPILQKYNYCMDTVQVLMRDTHEQLDLSLPVTVADGHRLQIVLLPTPTTSCSIDYQNGVGKSTASSSNAMKTAMSKSVSFPTTKLAAVAATRTGICPVAVATMNPHQSTLDEITNKVFNELLQSKVEAHSSGETLQQAPKAVDLCSLKSDDCASETSSIFERMRRRDSNIPGMKIKTKKLKSSTTSQSDEVIVNSGVEISNGATLPTTTPTTTGTAGVKKPIIAKLKAGVKLQVTERVAENQDELLEGLKRAQLARLEDQRGTEINFELPDFLKNKENLSAANKLRKMRANLSPISKSISTLPSPPSTQEDPPSPSSSLNERPQPAPRLSITNKNKTNISPMKIDEEDPALTEFENQANNNALSLPLIDGSADYANTKGPPPLPPKPKVLPIKPSNWGVTTSSSSANISTTVSKPNSMNYTTSSANNANNNNNNGTASSTLQMPSKIPIDVSRKHLGAEQTGRCAYLEEPSSSFV